DVVLDHRDPPGTVEHPERKCPLSARHLVVIQLHGIDRPAAKLIILRVGAENRGQQDTGGGALRMHRHFRLPRMILSRDALARGEITKILQLSRTYWTA